MVLKLNFYIFSFIIDSLLMMIKEDMIIIAVPIKKVEDNSSLKKYTPDKIPIGTEIYLSGASILAGANFKL